MVFKNWPRIFLLIASFFFCVGYRIQPGTIGWGIDTSSTAKRKVFLSVTQAGKTITNNLPSTDALGSAGSTLTESQLMQSIIDDFNGITRSSLILALDSDSDYAANKTNKRITIEVGSAAGQSSGEARLTFSGRTITDCKISLTDKAFTSAKDYVALVTHEIGHCLGLEHSQDSVWAVMSYFYNDQVYRLAIDDKMGIVHLYANTASDAAEKATFGAACSTQ